MTEEEYLQLGRKIWRDYVPKSGESETVQGELLRASAKLRDEAHRNGNGNWSEMHEGLAKYICSTISNDDDVAEDSKAQLAKDVTRILDYDHPYLEDDLFDRIERLVLDWCASHVDPIWRGVGGIR